jgi:hypothetical protein
VGAVGKRNESGLDIVSGLVRNVAAAVLRDLNEVTGVAELGEVSFVALDIVDIDVNGAVLVVVGSNDNVAAIADNIVAVNDDRSRGSSSQEADGSELVHHFGEE